VTAIPAAYLRGGTSKGVFFHERDLPPAGPERDDVLLRVLGSPDPLQIDGMGGTYSSTSKVVVVRPIAPEAVEYWFAQIGISEPIVDWSGNCGNLTTAVGPFAIDEGMVEAVEPITVLTLRNGNTGVTVEVEVEVVGGRARTTGTHRVAGVPGTGSPVVTRYLDPAGSVFGRLLPTGNAADILTIDDGEYEASVVDVTHPNVFVSGSAAGLGDSPPDPADLVGDAELLARAERLRGAAAVLLGRASSIDSAHREAPAVPRLIFVWPGVPGTDVRVLGFSMQKPHRALPMTGALCLAGAARTPGTVVHRMSHRDDDEVRIQHPKGVSEVIIDRDPSGDLRSVGVVRTARRLMDGVVYPREP
jgi:2-methylaconitate cis-trans-isomerase PrpF